MKEDPPPWTQLTEKTCVREEKMTKPDGEQLACGGINPARVAREARTMISPPLKILWEDTLENSQIRAMGWVTQNAARSGQA
jgi:hypothetical protein